MGILRYIVQGVGWEIGRSAAREGIEALENHADEVPDAEMLERERQREAARAAKDQADKRKRIEAELRELKRRR
jgi:hypothetical protein